MRRENRHCLNVLMYFITTQNAFLSDFIRVEKKCAFDDAALHAPLAGILVPILLQPGLTAFGQIWTPSNFKAYTSFIAPSAEIWFNGNLKQSVGQGETLLDPTLIRCAMSSSDHSTSSLTRHGAFHLLPFLPTSRPR